MESEEGDGRRNSQGACHLREPDARRAAGLTKQDLGVDRASLPLAQRHGATAQGGEIKLRG